MLYLHMQEIIRQLKFDIQNIESLTKAIENAKKEMILYKGKPAYKTRVEAIERWQLQIKEHRLTFDEYYIKLKELEF